MDGKRDFEFINYSSAKHVARITLTRPPLNVINIKMLGEIESALEQAAEEKALKVLILAAKGKLFSAGVDVAEHTPELVDQMIPLFNRVCTAIANFPLPTIAAIQGHALGGGCEFVICCDHAIMVENARIGQPEIKLASLAPIAALRLPLIVGPRWTARMLFSGEPIEAHTAARIGLVDRHISAEALANAVDELVDPLLSMSAAALRHNKAAYLLGMGAWMDRIMPLEKLYLDDLMRTDDAKEGLRAFLEKRDPKWKNS